MTSTEKFQNRKKHNYNNSLKEAACKQKSNNLSNLTVGSRAIKKMDYTSQTLSKEYRLMEESAMMKNGYKPRTTNELPIRLVTKKESDMILVLQKHERERLEELMFKPLKTGRNANGIKEQSLKRIKSTHPNCQSKTYAIE